MQTNLEIIKNIMKECEEENFRFLLTNMIKYDKYDMLKMYLEFDDLYKLNIFSVLTFEIIRAYIDLCIDYDKVKCFNLLVDHVLKIKEFEDYHFDLCISVCVYALKEYKLNYFKFMLIKCEKVFLWKYNYCYIIPPKYSSAFIKYLSKI